MKKVWPVIYSNNKIPQGQTVWIFDILLTRSLWKRVPSFILLWIYSRIQVIFDFIDLIISRRSCICKLKFIIRQLNKPKICVSLSKVITLYLYRHLCNKKSFTYFQVWRYVSSCARFTLQIQKLISMETKILSSAINFKPLFRHSNYLNSLIFCRLWLFDT